MNPLLTALVIVLSINALMWLSEDSITEMGGASFYNKQGILENHNLSNGADPYNELPTTGGAVTSDTGNIFIDTFGSFMNWLAGVTGFDTVIQTLKAPYTILKSFGIPNDIADLFGTLWYLVTILLVVLVVTGRN